MNRLEKCINKYEIEVIYIICSNINTYIYLEQLIFAVIIVQISKQILLLRLNTKIYWKLFDLQLKI